MAEKSPAFQWYARDYLTDENVELMELDEQGAYVRLLSYQWLEGSLPSDMKQLAKLCRVPATRMQRLWGALSCCFDDVGGGRMQNRRLEVERTKQDEWRAQQAEAGKRGAQKRWGGHSDPNGGPNGVPINSPLAKNSSASASASAVTDEQHSVVTDVTTGASAESFASPIGGEPQELPVAEPTFGELMGLARKQGFEADATDASILQALLRKQVKPHDIAIAIEGMALLVKSGGYSVPKGQRLNMKMLYHSDHGRTMSAWRKAEDAYIAAENSKPVSLAAL